MSAELNRVRQAIEVVEKCLKRKDKQDALDWMATVILRAAEFNAQLVNEIKRDDGE